MRQPVVFRMLLDFEHDKLQLARQGHIDE